MLSESLDRRKTAELHKNFLKKFLLYLVLVVIKSPICGILREKALILQDSGEKNV